ncbi:MAG TPA: PAS domain S-box protein [Bryobacteraceae bacterium]|nr:PAS domain S-box protein [Bryobacteraceae bacterium]
MNPAVSRVLLIEDNLADAHLLGELLRDAGVRQLELSHVTTLGEALDRLASEEFDVALVDLSLPDASDIEAVVCLHSSYAALPVVVLTGLDDEATAARAVREGAQDYLVKGATDGHLLLRAMRYASERRRAVDVLQRREEHFRSLIENALDLVAIVQPDAIIRYVSPSHQRILGWAAEELVGRDLLSLVELADHTTVREMLRDGVRRAFEYRMRHKGGGWRRVESYARNLSHVAGVGGIVVNSRDVTERHDFEERLRDVNLTLRAVVQASPLAIYSVNMNGSVRTWNEAAEKLFGWGETEVAGRTLPSITAAGETGLAERLALAREGRTLSGVPISCLRRDGASFDANLWNELLRDSTGTVIGLIEVIADVTEHKLLEQRVLQSQKMDAIARLASGIAHDFNNLLTVIAGYTNLLLAKCNSDEPAHADLEQVARAADRAADLTRQLLAFSRRQLVQSSNLDIGALLTEVEPILKRVVGDNVHLVATAAEDMPSVCADPGQIEQVLLNLALNARDAMPEGGTIAVDASAAWLDGEAAALAGVKPGEYAVIRVRDTGAGMTPEVQARVFEPFFTTKEQGKGTGLGLSTSYGIIRQNNGNIAVESQPGKGTLFTIWLPADAFRQA